MILVGMDVFVVNVMLVIMDGMCQELFVVISMHVCTSHPIVLILLMRKLNKVQGEMLSQFPHVIELVRDGTGI